MGHRHQDQCVRANVRFFFKQWGGVFKKRSGRRLDGRTWDEVPTALPMSPLNL
jgi:protein gp37